MEIHWRAPLQAKGFLKIVEAIIAIIALALVAGFSVDHHYTCPEDLIGGPRITFSVKYPFNTIKNTSAVGDDVTVASMPQTDEGITQGAQFFVAWGSLSLIYAIVALCVYMFVTANENLEKVVNFLVWADVLFHAVWVLNWFIASIQWAVVFNHLKNNLNRMVADIAVLEPSLCVSGPETFHDTYVQASMAVVFGFLSLFLWFINIFWVVIDTKFYSDWRAGRGGSDTL